MRPTECSKCGRHFDKHPLMQAEVRHTLALYGERAAQQLADELLEPVHDEHQKGKDDDRM